MSKNFTTYTSYILGDPSVNDRKVKVYNEFEWVKVHKIVILMRR